ncbi:MAG: phosphodiester glycosidase family protein [Polyangiaceae bacterium]|nr:phosphodiester glycosidase family protein [Polyangiaceae bacterium]
MTRSRRFRILAFVIPLGPPAGPRRLALSAWLTAALVALACATTSTGSTPPDQGTASHTTAPPASNPTHLPHPTATPGTVLAPGSAAVPPPRPSATSTVPFPPAAVAPPHTASAQPGDGTWTPLGDPERGERLSELPHVAFATTIHPHRVSRWKKLSVVAIDQSRVRVAFVPGTEDVSEAAVAAAGLTCKPGLVAEGDLPTVLFIHNGGFKPRHGHWGMMVDGATLVPPRPEGCTVAVRDDGRVTIGTYARLVPELGTIKSFRQTPPCLVEAGTIHPRLAARDERPWGGHNPKDVTRRRSAVGIDRTGHVLFYGMGEELEPSELAVAMETAGAVSAAELDINWSWTRFLVVGRRGTTPEITSTLIPQMVHERGAYLTRPAARDFFYVVRRPPASP